VAVEPRPSASADLLKFARHKAIRRIQPEVVEGGAGSSVLIAPELLDAW